MLPEARPSWRNCIVGAKPLSGEARQKEKKGAAVAGELLFFFPCGTYRPYSSCVARPGYFLFSYFALNLLSLYLIAECDICLAHKKALYPVRYRRLSWRIITMEAPRRRMRS
jgi:hypothetical protein